MNPILKPSSGYGIKWGEIENIYIRRHTIGLNISTCTSSLLQKFKAPNNFLMSSDLQKIKWSVQSLCLNGVCVTHYCPNINNYK